MEVLETQVFTKLLKALEIKDDQYRDFQNQLVGAPDLGDLIQGTGGVRKLRMKSAGGGKSGGYRVIYYWKYRSDTIYMLLIYPKSKLGNLSSSQKKALKQIIEEI